MQTLSITQHLNIYQTYVEETNSCPCFFVGWKTVKVTRSMLGKIKTETTETFDRLLFRTENYARAYGENVEAPSVPYCTYQANKPFYFSGHIFPKGWKKMREKLKPYVAYESKSDLNEMFRIDTSSTSSAPYVCIKSMSNKWIDLNSAYDYKNLLSHPCFYEKVNKILKIGVQGPKGYDLVKSIDISPVGTYESAVTGESFESKRSRDEIIDAELLRIEQYKNFLLSMK